MFSFLFAIQNFDYSIIIYLNLKKYDTKMIQK